MVIIMTAKATENQYTEQKGGISDDDRKYRHRQNTRRIPKI